MVFDRTSLIVAENSLWNLLDKIRSAEIRYDNYIIKVTMSFGISEWDKEQSLDSLIKSADDKLYFAKNNGRNRVVSAQEGEGAPENGEISEIDKLLMTINSGSSSGQNDGSEVHFENLSADELNAILSGEADDADTLSGPSGEPISFSEDSYT